MKPLFWGYRDSTERLAVSTRHGGRTGSHPKTLEPPKMSKSIGWWNPTGEPFFFSAGAMGFWWYRKPCLLVESVQKQRKNTAVKSSENCCNSWFPKKKISRTSRENWTKYGSCFVVWLSMHCDGQSMSRAWPRFQDVKMWVCDEGVFNLHISFSNAYIHMHVHSM